MNDMRTVSTFCDMQVKAQRSTIIEIKGLKEHYDTPVAVL